VKKLLTTLTYIALAAVIIGSIFKFNHWPGANKIFVTGNILFFILGTIWIFYRKRELVMILLGITLLVIFASFMWSIQHWPGEEILRWAVVFFVSILAAILYNRKE
jgi:hypothetical protein